ncbi:hypothetical protein ACM66B_004442 [Microbotryomycetes sp. NB124-2]
MSYTDDKDFSTRDDVFSATGKVQDEGAKIVLAAADQTPPSEDEITRVRRKADFLVLPLLCFTVGLQYCDKSALSTAALFGIIQDLKLYDIAGGQIDTHAYSMCVMIASVGYILGTFPLAYLAQKFPTGKACALYIFIWGVVLILTPLCKSYEGLLAQRFFLGFFEAGVSPVFLSILSMWYTQREQALRATLLFSANGLTVIPLLGAAYGLVTLDDKIAGWKIIYLFLGSLTIVWSVAFAVLVPDSPVTARFLNDRAKFVAVERLRSNQAGITSKTFRWEQVGASALDPKVWLLGIIIFCVGSPNGAIGSFTPLVIQNVYGATARRTLLLLMPAATVSGVSNLLAGTLTYLVPNTRCLSIIALSVITMIGAALEWKLPFSNKEGLLAALYLMSAFSGALGATTGLVTSNTAGASRKTLVGSVVFMFLNASNIAAPFFFFKSEQPRYVSGFKITLILLCIGIGCTMIYAALCLRDNRAREKLPKDETDRAFEDLTDLENKAFRYKL